MSGKKPKRSSKNLKINTRIVLTTVLAIAIPLVLVALVCLGLLHSTSHTFQLAAETADRYSLVNQIGWNQTVSNLSDVLLRTKDTDAEKLADIAAYAAPLEKRGVALEIRRGDEVFYRSAGCKDVVGRARQIVAFDSEKNVYYFGQDGLVIVSHVQAGGQRCRLVLTGTGYTVADQTEPAAVASVDGAYRIGGAGHCADFCRCGGGVLFLYQPHHCASHSEDCPGSGRHCRWQSGLSDRL